MYTIELLIIVKARKLTHRQLHTRTQTQEKYVQDIVDSVWTVKLELYVFPNKHLTRYNADLARKAQQKKKWKKKIQNTWTTNCKIFTQLSRTPEEAKVLVIRSME